MFEKFQVILGSDHRPCVARQRDDWKCPKYSVDRPTFESEVPEMSAPSEPQRSRNEVCTGVCTRRAFAECLSQMNRAIKPNRLDLVT